jgi:acetylornithine deacetylase/succinyl-diaminopimelate desuccinylase-like protein
MNQTVEIKSVLRMIDARKTDSLRRLFEILKIPSVGTDPAHAFHCARAAQWVAKQLRGLGFTTALHQTTGQPVVIGTLAGFDKSAPHVLFYGHYDVQPADPLDLWTSPPFEPAIRRNQSGEDCIYARGAQDNKGQFMTFLEAVRTILTEGPLPFTLTILIEGDEEGSDAHLEEYIAERCKKLKPDIAFVCDTNRWSEKRPAIITQLRGCISAEIEITGTRVATLPDGHGQLASNPGMVLAKILADMHDDTGRVMIPGFYTGVKPPSPEARAAWEKLGFNGTRFLRDVGLSTAVGEVDYSILEQVWARPTAEFNGIEAGEVTSGMSYRVPKAMAKITFRTVQGQVPAKLQAGLKRFIEARIPAGCTAKVIETSGDNRAITVSSDSPWVKIAAKALKEEWGSAPVLAGEGGSIPVVACFKKYFGIDSLLVGFGLDSDAIHSPNENYPVQSYYKGIRSWARILTRIGTQK